MIKYVVIFILITIIGIFYDKYMKKVERETITSDYDLVKKYLLNEEAFSSNTPIIWVHLDYKMNSREWLNFGSRNTKGLNQPYKYITIQSIINRAKGKFNVCLVDDESFAKLIPGWRIDIGRVSDPMKEHFRTLGIVKLLYYYGGMSLSSSYLALEDLDKIYGKGLEQTTAFTFEGINRTMSSYVGNKINDYTPNYKMMGCVKHSPIMKELVLYLERLNSKDFTNEQDFVGDINRWLYSKIVEVDLDKKMNIIDGGLIGIKNREGQPVLLDDLLESSYIDFVDELQGIYIPDDEILKRTKYEWFARLGPKEIYDSNIILGKYMLLSNGM